MEIGTYVERSLQSEMSGNIIDVCPVGALTSRPFRFKARSWELQQHATVAPHDSVGSNLYVHTRNGRVMRVVPRENEEINEVWLSDRDRFSYEGLYTDDRLATGTHDPAGDGGAGHEVEVEALHVGSERARRIALLGVATDGRAQLHRLAARDGQRVDAVATCLGVGDDAIR